MEWSSLDFGGRVLLAVFAGGIANFLLGALWYALLFNKPWVAATGRTVEEFKATGGPGPSMALTVVGGVVTTFVLAMLYQWSGASSVMDGVLTGLVLGLGISVWERLKTAVYNVDERVEVWTLFSIDAAYNVSGLALAGAVYALIV